MPIEINKVDLGLDFLSIISQEISNLTKDGHKVIVLFPNIRPIRFVNKMLTLEQNLCTEFYTIEKFLYDMVINYYPSKIKYLNQIERVLLILKLIKSVPEIYNYLGGRDDLVYLWAKRLSSVFEEIDKQMLGGMLQNFQYVEAIDEAKKIIENIKTLYKGYRELLLNLTSNGDIYLKTVDAVKTEDFKQYVKDKTILVCGTVYLSNAELKIYEEIANITSIKFFFHTDLNERDHFDFEGEKYSFGIYSIIDYSIEKLKKISNLIYKDHEGEKRDTKINIHELSDTLSEGKVLKDILPKNTGEIEANCFGIILPSESSLMPILSQLDNMEINVTMGYPFRNTEAGIFISHLFDVLSELYNKFINNQPLILNYETILKLLDSSICYGVKSSYFDAISLRKSIYEDRMPAVNIETKGYANLFLKFLQIKSLKDFSSLMEEFFNNLEEEKIDIFTQKNIFLFLSKVIYPLKEIYSEKHFDVNIIFVQRIIMDMINDLYIPFEGDPLRGLQIMGFLESRYISFDTVVFVDMNEGVIPPLHKVDPLLPENIRKDIGLPSYKEREDLVRYNFFRALHSSNTAHIFYKSGSSSTERFLRSRFVEQLILMEELRSKSKFHPQRYYFSIFPNKNESDGIKKDSFVAKKVEELVNNKLSPTQIDEYIKCPYFFYLKRVKGIKGRVNFQSGFDAVNVGKLVHNILEQCYKNIKGSLTDKDIDNFSKLTNSTIEDFPKSIEKFKDFESIDTFLKKLDKFRFEVLKITIKDRLFKYFKWQKEIIRKENIEIIDLEKYLLDKKLNIHGYADRIELVEKEDKKETILRIIDYKTGGYSRIFSQRKLKKVDFETLEGKFGLKEIEIINRYVPSVQLPLYIIAASNEYGNKKFEAVIHNISEPEKFLAGTISLSKDDDDFPRYYDIIKYITQHMINSEKIYPLPGDGCKYCEYLYMCKFEKV